MLYIISPDPSILFTLFLLSFRLQISIDNKRNSDRIILTYYFDG